MKRTNKKPLVVLKPAKDFDQRKSSSCGLEDRVGVERLDKINRNKNILD